MHERRAPFVVDEAKFSTQRIVTFIILFIFIIVVVNVMFYMTDKAERSTILQTVINLTFLAVGFWLGSSKSAADKDNTAARIARDAVTPGPETPAGIVPAAAVVKDDKK